MASLQSVHFPEAESYVKVEQNGSVEFMQVSVD